MMPRAGLAHCATVLLVLGALPRGAHAAPAPVSDAEQIVQQYVRQFGNMTFREPSGQLKHKYLVPGGYYQQLWDWDSMLTGTALLSLGSAPYLAGSSMNFLDGVNLTDGMVPGCVTPSGASPAIYHAKPVIMQGAWIAAKAQGDYEQFRRFLPQMRALDQYWERTSRDPATGLYRWHDQMESGCDNLLTSVCPSSYGLGPPSFGKCWAASEAYSLASSDIMVFLHREKLALRNFLGKFGDAEGAAAVEASAKALKLALNTYLWDEQRGVFLAYNTSTRTRITAKTHLLGFPLFGGPELISAEQAQRSYAQLSAPDMLSAYGIRSASSDDQNYTNADYVTPYSNWRGPVWINTNAMICFGLASMGMKQQALDVAQRVVNLLAADIKAHPALAKQGKVWRECYSSADGSALAAPGFLNWNTLAGELLSSLRAGKNPFDLSP